LSPATSFDDLIRADNLVVQYKVGTGFLGQKIVKINPVDHVSLSIRKGEVFTVIGESGSGKTTLGLSMLLLIKPKSGVIYFDGKVVKSDSDQKKIRRSLQLVFQDPYSSLDSRMKVGDIVAEPLLGAGEKDRSSIKDRVLKVLELVGLDSSSTTKYPHEFSGGQRQRIAIARALVAGPRFIVLDEPTSSLDVSIQAQILNLILDLQEKWNLSYLFITHNMAVAKYVSDQIAVMYAGEIIERGSARDVIENPLHPYTADLIKSVPTEDIEKKVTEVEVFGDPPSLYSLPSGCRYSNRCKFAMQICTQKQPALVKTASGREVACFLHHTEIKDDHQ
jgi:oligopeptide/dipeptide ABC transporter ATP-binding protein